MKQRFSNLNRHTKTTFIAFTLSSTVWIIGLLTSGGGYSEDQISSAFLGGFIMFLFVVPLALFAFFSAIVGSVRFLKNFQSDDFLINIVITILYLLLIGWTLS